MHPFPQKTAKSAFSQINKISPSKKIPRINYKTEHKKKSTPKKQQIECKLLPKKIAKTKIYVRTEFYFIYFYLYFLCIHILPNPQKTRVKCIKVRLFWLYKTAAQATTIKCTTWFLWPSDDSNYIITSVFLCSLLLSVFFIDMFTKRMYANVF